MASVDLCPKRLSTTVPSSQRLKRKAKKEVTPGVKKASALDQIRRHILRWQIQYFDYEVSSPLWQSDWVGR